MHLLKITGLALAAAVGMTAAAAMAVDARIEVTGRIAASPCKVSVGAIDLGDVPIASFQGPGRPASGGGQSTQLRLTDCPYGLSKLTYRIAPSNGAFDAAKGIAKLDAASTASGVAVQLTRDPSGDVPLDQETTWTAYQPEHPDSDANAIALKAFYYQTADTVGEGSANASFTITFNFQ